MKRVISGATDFVVDDSEFNDNNNINTNNKLKKQRRDLGNKPKNNSNDIDQMLKNQVSTSFNKSNILSSKHEVVDVYNYF